MSIMSELAVKNPPTVGPGEILDFCYRCGRLSAIGKIVYEQQPYQRIAYQCTLCSVRFARTFELVKSNGIVGSVAKSGRR
jgi:hypothetical protein